MYMYIYNDVIPCVKCITGNDLLEWTQQLQWRQSRYWSEEQAEEMRVEDEQRQEELEESC